MDTHVAHTHTDIQGLRGGALEGFFIKGESYDYDFHLNDS